MAVEFTTDGQGIAFGNQANGLTTYSTSTWYYADSDGFGLGGVLINGGDSSEPVAYQWGAFSVSISAAPFSGKLILVQSFDGAQHGRWYANTAPSLNAWHHFSITYDNTNVANDPIFYLDGVSVAITENTTPVGSAITTSDLLGLGYTVAAENQTHDGKLQDVRIYNRILSAQEIGILAISRRLKVVMNGLVFWAPMWGANSDTFDGLVLTSDHRITDWAGGAQGTPAGSPIGRGNTIQGY